MHAPDAIFLNHLAGCVERQAIKATQRVDLRPMLSEILVAKRNMVRPVGPIALAFAARIEPKARHQEFRKSRNCSADPSRLF
ncbi:hypothetical protein GCM10007858_40120 [Bradyrhizobium liaoningense]|nr:hypothetical protein GCM10007858_40120 [Bradyrhizobium liaoningense]